MDALQRFDSSTRNAGLVALGLVAGGATWYATDGVLPPALVFAVAFVGILVVERYDW